MFAAWEKKKNCGKIVSNSLLRRFQCKSSLPSLLWNHSKLPANSFERLYYLWWPRVRESSVTTVVQARMKVNMGMWGHDGDIPWGEDGEWRGLRERPGEALRSLEKRVIPNLSIHFPLYSKHLKQKKKKKSASQRKMTWFWCVRELPSHSPTSLIDQLIDWLIFIY